MRIKDSRLASTYEDVGSVLVALCVLREVSTLDQYKLRTEREQRVREGNHVVEIGDVVDVDIAENGGFQQVRCDDLCIGQQCLAVRPRAALFH
jgi:hypothetical protein